MLTFSADLKGPIHESKQLRQVVVVSGVVLAGFSLQMLVGSVLHRYKAPGKGSRYFAKSLTVVPCVAGIEIHLPMGSCCSTGKDVW